MENKEAVLRTSFRGYDKVAVIIMFDHLNNIIMQRKNKTISLAEAWSLSSEFSPYKIKTVLFGGFDKKDVEKYYKRLIAEIKKG